MKRGMFILAVCWYSDSDASSLSLIWKNNSAVQKIAQEKNLEAHEDFVSLLAEDPYDLFLQFNLGSSLDVLGEQEKSEKSYLEILKMTETLLKNNPSPEELKKILTVRFAALYNLGVHAGAQKKIDTALDYYQQALALNPDSKEIKTNIELLIRQGQGGGEGEDQKQDESSGEGQNQKPKDQDESKDQKKPEDKKDQQKPENKPKEFDQSQMSKEDLKRILEELKEQEQGIRAKMQRKGDKEESNEKDW